MPEIHVFPVPRGMTADEAFAEMDLMGELVEYRWWRPRFHWPLVKWAYQVVDD